MTFIITKVTLFSFPVLRIQEK